MARALRIEYPGAVYHVMARGNQGQRIFADDLDRKRWLEKLGQAVEKTGWKVHAYVLMGTVDGGGIRGDARGASGQR